MEVIWLVLSLVVVDLAAFLFAADTRPGLQHTSRWPGGLQHTSRWPGGLQRTSRWDRGRRTITG